MKNPTGYPLYFSRFDLAAAVSLAVVLALTGTLPAAPAELPAPQITDQRTCAALQVYQLAKEDDFFLSATIASTSLNAFQASGAEPSCGKELASALSGPFNARAWTDALTAVDAVTTGDYALPDACGGATAILPSLPVVPSPDGAPSQCVIYDLAFQ